MTPEEFDTVTGADEDPNPEASCDARPVEPTHTAEGRHEDLLWGVCADDEPDRG